MKVDLELESWRDEWRSDSPAVVPDLAKRVATGSRRLRWTLAAEVAVTLAVGGFWSVAAVVSANRGLKAVAAATWVFFAAAWIFAIWTRRGLWSPAAQTTAAFVELSVRRCRASRAAVDFGLLLYFCEVFFCLAWIHHMEFQRTPPFAWTFLRAGPVIIVAAATPFVLGVAFWYRRVKTRELVWLMALQGAERQIRRPRESSWTAGFQRSIEHAISRLKRRRVL